MPSDTPKRPVGMSNGSLAFIFFDDLQQQSIGLLFEKCIMGFSGKPIKEHGLSHKPILQGNVSGFRIMLFASS